MRVKYDYDIEELKISLSTEETKKLESQGWLYDHDEDVLVLYDKEDNMYSVFKNIEMRVPDSYSLTLNKYLEEVDNE